MVHRHRNSLVSQTVKRRNNRMEKAHIKELYNSYSGTFRVNTSGRIRKAEHVAYIGRMGKARCVMLKIQTINIIYNFGCMTSKNNIEERWVIQI
jgi:hypothetical protein